MNFWIELYIPLGSDETPKGKNKIRCLILLYIPLGSDETQE